MDHIKRTIIEWPDGPLPDPPAKQARNSRAVTTTRAQGGKSFKIAVTPTLSHNGKTTFRRMSLGSALQLHDDLVTGIAGEHPDSTTSDIKPLPAT